MFLPRISRPLMALAVSSVTVQASRQQTDQSEHGKKTDGRKWPTQLPSELLEILTWPSRSLCDVKRVAESWHAWEWPSSCAHCESKNESSESKAKVKEEPEWAYPSPYDNDQPVDRFVDISQYIHHKQEFDLANLVKLWEKQTGEESWPWVWTWHNSVGPHHVFIGLSEDTLRQLRYLAKEKVNNNMTLVVKSVKDIDDFPDVDIKEIWAARCAVIESDVRQLDTQSKMLMLEDERIICYDKAYLS